MTEKRKITIDEDEYLKLLNKKEGEKPDEDEEEEEEEKEEEKQKKKPIEVRPAEFEDEKKKRKRVVPKTEVIECPRCENTANHKVLYEVPRNEIAYYKGKEVMRTYRCGKCNKKFVLVRD